MIEIKNLYFGYAHMPVFSNISLNFEPGCIYGLLGENGVGKTTLLKLLSGLLHPTQGSCTIDNFTCADRTPQFLQNICFLPDEITVPSNATPLSYIKQLVPFYPAYSEDAFLDMMRSLEVDPARKFKEMSFGQQKKSLIACALSLGTQYVLLDEPTNGLDIPSKANFRKILGQRADNNACIIISTHQVKDVENLIDPIIILTNDDVLLNASVQRITEQLSFVYDSQQRPDALYSEMQPAGWLNVVPNTTGEETLLNIEALFNAVLLNKEQVKNLFK